MHNGNERYRNLIFCRSSMLRLFLWQEEDWLFEDRNLQKRRRGKGFFANTPETKLNYNSWQIAVHLYALFYYPFSFSLVKQRCTETKQRSLKYARRLPVVKLDVTRGLLNVTFVVLGISVTKIQVMLEHLFFVSTIPFCWPHINYISIGILIANAFRLRRFRTVATVVIM